MKDLNVFYVLYYLNFQMLKSKINFLIIAWLIFIFIAYYYYNFDYYKFQILRWVIFIKKNLYFI
jgi:hypothetical protein